MSCINWLKKVYGRRMHRNPKPIGSHRKRFRYIGNESGRDGNEKEEIEAIFENCIKESESSSQRAGT